MIECTRNADRTAMPGGELVSILDCVMWGRSRTRPLGRRQAAARRMARLVAALPDRKPVPCHPPTADEVPEPPADGIRTVPDRPAPSSGCGSMRIGNPRSDLGNTCPL